MDFLDPLAGLQMDFRKKEMDFHSRFCERFYISEWVKKIAIIIKNRSLPDNKIIESRFQVDQLKKIILRSWLPT